MRGAVSMALAYNQVKSRLSLETETFVTSRKSILLVLNSAKTLRRNSEMLDACLKLSSNTNDRITGKGEIVEKGAGEICFVDII